ncbi:hypothetical protein AOQ84DRAFT_328059, partial [Glonium stellatum]
MSVVLARASRLKPEIRLAQAISAFEADLSSAQKATLRTYKSQSLNSPPDVSDVMQLTAEIDSYASGKAAGRRCFGPRLTNFLQAVQQYAALGDIIIGGSQNLIACGVWSLVRMSLLLIVNFSSYFEKLSTLLMNVGRSAPRYQAMTLLYPQSKVLQSHLSEYFIVVVHLCHKLLEFTQKSTFGQVTYALSNSDMTNFQSEFDRWANSIKEEANLLMAKKFEEEAQENSRFRDLSTKFSKSASRQQRLATKLRILDFCSNYDYETTWKQARKAGTTTLLNRNSKYQDWKGRTDSCTLVYTGKLGSGKSVLMANIVDDIHLYVRSKSIVVAYFFCRHDIPESLKARTVIGSLARQLLCSIPNLTIAVELLDQATPAPDFSTLISILQCALPPDCKMYFILDGLDECDDIERETLIQQVGKLQEVFVLSLCVSFRLEPDNALGLSSEPLAAVTITSIPEENPDIESFIKAELESRVDARKLVIGNPNLILEIQDALEKGSQGMFLWVVLQIDALCTMRTDDTIRGALADLPKDLPETFSRILQRSEGFGKNYQRPIPELITVAHRPLTIEELGEALSVVPGDSLWNPARLLNDVYSTLKCCGCLLTVDEDELTVRLVHHSVKQFLLSGPTGLADVPITMRAAQKRMGGIIITYLSYGVFETQLSTSVVPQMMTGSVPSKIIHSTLDSASSVRGLALTLLRSGKRPGCDIGKILAETSKHFGRLVYKFHFLSYARLYWLQHILDVSEPGPIMCDMLLILMKKNAVNINAADEDSWKLMLWAYLNGHAIIVKHLLESGNFHLHSMKISGGQKLLFMAAKDGDVAVVKLLLERGGVYINSRDEQGQTALWKAAGNGHEVVVKLLLKSREIDVNSWDGEGRTPLWKAVENGDEAVVKLLLTAKKINVDPRKTLFETPFSKADIDPWPGTGHSP